MINLSKELLNDNYYLDIVETYMLQDKEFSLGMNIEELREELLNEYEWSLPKLVKIPKPNGKLRDIFIFNDKDAFVLKLLNLIITKGIGNVIMDCVYSYKKGVRCYNAAKVIQDSIKEENLVGMKIDITNYFQSVPSRFIYNFIEYNIEDTVGKELLYKLYSINKVVYKGDIIDMKLGLMPGSALSSFLANYILTPLDKDIISYTYSYARYSDDLIIMCKTKEELDIVYDNLKNKLLQFELGIKDEKVKYYDYNDTIDFLGLDITKDSIDVNRDTYNKLKSVIKSLGKKYSKLSEGKSKEAKLRTVSNAIQTINRVLLYTLIQDSTEHKSGRLGYIFSNVTTDYTIKQLDYYILDTLRFVYSNKHNKGTVSLLSTSNLEVLGYKSYVQLYNLYKISSSVCVSEVSRLLNSREVTPKFRNTKTEIDIVKEIEYNNSFYKFFLSMLNSKDMCFINKYGIEIQPIHVLFNLDSHSVCLGEETIINNNLLVKDYLIVKKKDKHIKVIFKEKEICKDIVVDRDLVIQLYLSSSFKSDFSFKGERNGYSYYPFKCNSLNKLSFYLSNEYLRTDLSTPMRRTRFLFYMYMILNSNADWNDIDVSNKFNIIKIKYDFDLVIPREWLSVTTSSTSVFS